MPTNFPTSVDNFTNPTANDSLNLPSHSTQHANANDAIEAIETFLLPGGSGASGLVRVIPTSATNGTVSATGDVTFSGVSSLTINGCFTTTYTNYLLSFEITAGTANVEVRAQFSASATPSSTGYAYSRTASDSAAASRFEGSNSIAQVPVTFIPYNSQITTFITVRNPAQAAFTHYTSQWFYDDGGTYMGGLLDARHRVATAYDGIKFFNATTMTGTVRVYGYK